MVPKTTTDPSSIRAAIYARVSSDQQTQTCTIDSQVADLRQRVAADGLALDDELCFIDDGFTGSTLVRPALERLRDTAWAGGFQRLYVHSPDRLARKYAWQMLLVEELHRGGVELVFLNHTIGASPEEDLLLQMQGMIAEYERTKIMERSRRGKRHAAKRGSVNVLMHAPYGYRYIGKHEGGGHAQYQVNFEQAKVVRQIFEWYGRDRLTLREIVRRLTREGIASARGNRWCATTVGHLLRNTAYKGQAIFGKTRSGERRPRLRPPHGRPEHPRYAASRYATAPEDQIIIPVPAIVSDDLFDAIAEQMAENRKRRREQHDVARHLLQGMVECGCCGYAYYGHGKFVKKKRVYGYYRCSGSDAYRFGGAPVCKNKSVRMEPLDTAVWEDVVAMLQNPADLRHEFERRMNGEETTDVNIAQVNKQLAATRRSISRLIDAYESGLLDKAEFEPRIRSAKQRVEQLEKEATAASDYAVQQAELRLVLSHLDQFAQQVRQGLDQADWNTRREIIRSLVKVVKVEPDHVRITYRVSPRPFDAGRLGGQSLQHCHSRVHNYLVTRNVRVKTLVNCCN